MYRERVRERPEGERETRERSSKTSRYMLMLETEMNTLQLTYDLLCNLQAKMFEDEE